MWTLCSPWKHFLDCGSGMENIADHSDFWVKKTKIEIGKD